VKGIAAALSFYPPRLEQGSHDHDVAHLSVVLAGGFEEEQRSSAAVGQAGDMLHRHAGVRHRVTYGRHGALVLTLQALAADVDPSQAAPSGAQDRPAPLKAAPAWLVEARARLQETPASTSLARLAREVGVHPVHLSRSFVRHFGRRPSIVRRDAMVGHALALALAQNEPLAACAQAAGFADQAHLTRAVRAVCGFPPARLRQLLS